MTALAGRLPHGRGLRALALAAAALALAYWPVPAGYGWSFALWIVAIVAYVMSFPGRKHEHEAPEPGVLAGLAAILAVGAAFRFPWIASIPGNISIDEVLPGLEALHIASGEYHNVFSTVGWFTIPAVSFSIPALIMEVLPGAPFVALRLSSALTGMIGLVAIFLLARRLFNDHVALAATALGAVNFWHVHNSRTGFPFVQTISFVPMALYFLVRARQDRSARGLALFGVVLAAVLQCYFPVRALLMLVPMFLLTGWIGRRDSPRTVIAEAATIGFGALLMLAPLLRSEPIDEVFGRSQSVLITRAAVQTELERIYRVEGLPAVAWRNLQEAGSMLTEWADVCILNRSPGGLFDRLTLTAIAVGTLVAIGQARIEALLLLGWIAAVFVLGVAMTDAPRASYRLGPALPAFLLLGGFAFDRTLFSQLPSSRWYRATVIPAVFVSVALAIGLQNYQSFFYDYAVKGDGRDVPLASAWRLLAERCDGRFFYFVAAPEPMGSEPMLDLFCPQHAPIAIEQVPRNVDERRAATFIVMSWQRTATDRLTKCYPDAVVTEHRTSDRRFLFTTVEVDADEVRSGLKYCPEAPKPITIDASDLSRKKAEAAVDDSGARGRSPLKSRTGSIAAEPENAQAKLRQPTVRATLQAGLSAPTPPGVPAP